MKNLTAYQIDTLRLIKQATKEDPITGKDVALRIGLRPRSTGKEGADMRSVIHALRVKGYPVCASGKGYYYAKTFTELSEFISSLNGRIKKIEEAVEGLQQGFTLIGEEEKKSKINNENINQNTML